MKNRRLAIGFEIEARDQLVAEQQREHEVSVLAGGLGYVDLDAVVEIEDTQRAGAILDERIER